MSGPVTARPRTSVPCAAWQVEAGSDQLRAAAKWSRCAYGIWGEDAPQQVVWLHLVEGQTPAYVGDWILRECDNDRVFVVDAATFSRLYRVVEP